MDRKKHYTFRQVTSIGLSEDVCDTNITTESIHFRSNQRATQYVVPLLPINPYFARLFFPAPIMCILTVCLHIVCIRALGDMKLVLSAALNSAPII